VKIKQKAGGKLNFLPAFLIISPIFVLGLSMNREVSLIMLRIKI